MTNLNSSLFVPDNLISLWLAPAVIHSSARTSPTLYICKDTAAWSNPTRFPREVKPMKSCSLYAVNTHEKCPSNSLCPS